MTAGYEISAATVDDISGILVLQEANLPEHGGSLSVRQSSDWFTHSVDRKSLVVCRRGAKIVGYILGTEFAEKAHVPIVHAMAIHYPPPLGCYLYGPVCVAENERGNGLAVAMFKELQTHMHGRPAMTFVRADNAPSIRVHEKMGLRSLGTFVSGDVTYVALLYSGM
jgi:RimJ/RimL family protein N-acetyltransferase